MITVIGTATVDLIAPVSDEFLARHNLGKGICTVITREKQDELLGLFDYTIVPGGSGANQAACLALLGCPDVRFMGPTGHDDHGRLSRQSLTNIGVDCLFTSEEFNTQIIFIFLTEDGDRSFAAYYDENMGLTEGALVAATAGEDNVIAIHGFALLYPKLGTMVEQFVTARDWSSRKLVFCPNDESAIDQAASVCNALYNASSHVLMNRHEGTCLLKEDGCEAIVVRMLKDGKQGALTDSANGAHILHAGQATHTPSLFDPARLVDSNGAGDAFAAGYLYSMVHNFDPAKTGMIASKTAAALLAMRGARPPLDLKAQVFTETL